MKKSGFCQEPCIVYADNDTMDRHMNIEDNMFVFNVRIRMIQDLLLLDTDADLFLNKTLEDLEFIDLGLTSLLSVLKTNVRLIERDEQLFNLSESERLLSELLMELIHGDGTISAVKYPAIREKASAIKTRSMERRRNIGEMMTESKAFTLEPVVSYDELHELLSN
jgi:hypothetical protein